MHFFMLFTSAFKDNEPTIVSIPRHKSRNILGECLDPSRGWRGSGHLRAALTVALGRVDLSELGPFLHSEKTPRDPSCCGRSGTTNLDDVCRHGQPCATRRILNLNTPPRTCTPAQIERHTTAPASPFACRRSRSKPGAKRRMFIFTPTARL